MNTSLLEFWIVKALEVAQKKEARKNTITCDKVKRILLERMCNIARNANNPHQIVINANMRYSDPKLWYGFEPGIFEMRDFGFIIDENISGVMKDAQRKSDYYFQTLAASLMGQYYRENPLRASVN